MHTAGTAFSFLPIADTPEQWESFIETVRSAEGKYIYLFSNGERPDDQLVRGMLRRASASADLIVPAVHLKVRGHEILEEPLTAPLPLIFERHRIAPMLNGSLIKKELLLKGLENNVHDWIHSPCPELFFLLFHPMQVQMIRTDCCHSEKSFIRFCRQYKEASAWLDRQSLPNDVKTPLQSRILQYEDYLIDYAVRLNLTDKDMELFKPVSVIHNYYTCHPEKLIRKTTGNSGMHPGPVRCLAVFCSALRTGGAERCASLLLAFFSSLPGLKICLFQDSDPAPGDYPCPETVDITVLPKEFYARYVCLPGLLRSKQVDTCLFFDHFLPNFYFDILTAGELGLRTIAMEHNTFAFPLFCADIRLLRLRQSVYAGTDLVTCLSRSDEYIWNSRGIRARYMPNPLTFDPSVCSAFADRKSRNLIFIARMTPGKGVLDALKTVEEVRKKHPDVKLFMMGAFPNPEFECEIRDYVCRHQLEKSVEFTGFTTEVEKYISQSAIHLMPSCVEGYPMTLMEAKSYGLPTVSYFLPYLEAGQEEYGTVMVPQGDYLAMAEKVSGLLDDPVSLDELGRKARESLKWFDNRMVFQRWQALFNWLESGREPEELKLPVLTADQKIKLLQIQTQVILSGIDLMSSSGSNRKKMLNEVLTIKRKDDFCLDFCLRIYFALRGKMENSIPFFIKSFFAVSWRLKKMYRMIRPVNENE